MKMRLERFGGQTADRPSGGPWLPEKDIDFKQGLEIKLRHDQRLIIETDAEFEFFRIDQ